MLYFCTLPAKKRGVGDLMLALKRRPGDTLVLLDLQGNRIATIHVNECGTRGVSLGIDAGPEVRILRGELLADLEAAA
jgi:hypothetical protein